MVQWENMANRSVNEIAEQSYNYGWSTEIEEESAPFGLNEDIVKWISHKKKEPEWLLEWRLAIRLSTSKHIGTT